MRTETEDPMYQVTFQHSGSYTKYDYRRVGRPRGQWTEQTITETLWDLEGDEYIRNNDKENLDAILMLFIAAIERKSYSS